MVNFDNIYTFFIPFKMKISEVFN